MTRFSGTASMYILLDALRFDTCRIEPETVVIDGERTDLLEDGFKTARIVSAMRTPSCHALREGAPLFGQTAHCQETREVADGRWFRRTMGTLIEPSKSGRLVAPMQSIRTSLCSTCGVESRPTERVRGLDQTEDVHGSSLVLI